MTARPSGAFLLAALAQTQGHRNMPMIIASAVMITGRSRVIPAARAASWALWPFAPIVGEGDQQNAVGGCTPMLMIAPMSEGR